MEIHFSLKRNDHSQHGTRCTKLKVSKIYFNHQPSKVFILHAKSSPLFFQNISFYLCPKLELTSSNTIQCPDFNAASSGPSRQANSPPFPPSTGKSVPNKSVTSFGRRQSGGGRKLQNSTKVRK